MPEIYVTEQLEEAVYNGGKLITLTPDDILTLRLLRDEFSQSWMFRNTRPGTEDRTNLNKELTLDTLNHILKQVE